MKTVVSYGAGTNSTAMVIAMLEEGATIDAIVFADTGGERPETYEFIHTFSQWLQARGLSGITVVKADNSHGTLEQECLDRKTLPAVAFGWKTCSDKWKVRPFKNWLKKQGWQDVTVCIGFDADEQARATRGDSKESPYAKSYPLIEMQMGREECIRTIVESGLPLPGKSACFFCPNSKQREILDLPSDLQARAIAMEANAEKAHTVKGLGRNWSWTSLIAGDQAQGKLFDTAKEMPCGCYDGN